MKTAYLITGKFFQFSNEGSGETQIFPSLGTPLHDFSGMLCTFSAESAVEALKAFVEVKLDVRLITEFEGNQCRIPLFSFGVDLWMVLSAEPLEDSLTEDAKISLLR